MKVSKFFSIVAALATAAMSLSSCSDEKFDPSIFPEGGDELDPNSVTYKFDKWLQQTYLTPYNLDFRYKMQDVGADMNYNLVPAEYDKAVDLAVLTNHLWFEAYKEVVGDEFLKMYGPRIIHLIGSSALNPSSGTEILGLAEGGIKVSLFKVNFLNVNDFNNLNEMYFKTMHHEFAHILHQTKTYPTEFNLISNGLYDDNNWQDRQESMLRSKGFVTNYASSQTREDFAETIANFIVKTDEQWAAYMKDANRGWETPTPAEGADVEPDAIYYCFYYYNNNQSGDDNKQYAFESAVVEKEEDGKIVYYHKTLKDDKKNPIRVYPVEDKDGIDGEAVILRKVNIARVWLRDEFGVDLDQLREVVQRRQSTYDINALRKQVEDIQ